MLTIEPAIRSNPELRAVRGTACELSWLSKRLVEIAHAVSADPRLGLRLYSETGSVVD